MAPRTRVTLAVTLITAAALGVAGGAVYLTFANQLQSDVETRLDRLADLVLRSDPTVGAAFITTALPAGGGHDEVLAIGDDTGGAAVPLTPTTRALGVTVPPRIWGNATSGGASFTTVAGVGGDYRFVVFPAPPHLVVANHALAAVALGQSLRPDMIILRELVGLLAAVGVTAVALAAAAAWFGSKRLRTAMPPAPVAEVVGRGRAGPAAVDGVLILRLGEAARRRLADIGPIRRMPAMGTSASGDPSWEEEVPSPIERLETAVEHLALLTRIECGGLRRQSFSWAPLLEDALREGRRICAPRSMVVDVGTRLGTAVGDVEAIEELLRILCRQAADRSPPTATVTVSARAAERSVVLTVGDDAERLSPARLARLFDTASISRDDEAGLSRAVAAAIVEAHGGSISAVPADPAGVLVRVNLPLGAPSGDLYL